MRRWLVGMLALVTLSGCGPAGPGRRHAGDIALAAARRALACRRPRQDATDARRRRSTPSASPCTGASPRNPGGQPRPVAGEHRARAGDGAGWRPRTDGDGDGRRPPRVRDRRACGLAGGPRLRRWPPAPAPFTDPSGKPADVTLRIVNAPFADRSLPARARLPRRPRRPLRRRPAPGRLQDGARGGPGPDQRLGGRPDRAAHSCAAGAGDGRRPDAPGAGKRRLPQGRLAVPVRRRRHEPGSVHDAGRHRGRRAGDARLGRVPLRVGRRMEGGRAAVRRRQALDARDRPGRPRGVRDGP